MYEIHMIRIKKTTKQKNMYAKADKTKKCMQRTNSRRKSYFLCEF
jgi:hypothetical protein